MQETVGMEGSGVMSDHNTPMLSQYWSIKKQCPDSILFYRLGDFYEMFFEDAKVAAPVLEVQLTSRDKSVPNPVPMCGVPYHSASLYIQKLLSRGYKVAICEQVEEALAGQDIIRREIVRILTPALIPDPDLVSEDDLHCLFCVNQDQNQHIEVCIVNLLAGEVRLGKVDSLKGLQDLTWVWHPREVLVSGTTQESTWFRDWIQSQKEVLTTVRDTYFSALGSLEAARSYLKETQKGNVAFVFRDVLPLSKPKVLKLDGPSIAALEILENRSRKGGASLLQVMDHTCTAMGRRCLKEWLTHPLTERERIEKRLDAVELLEKHSGLRESLKSLLQKMRDLERLATKTALGLSMPRDLVAIRNALSLLPDIKGCLESGHSPLFQEYANSLELLHDLNRELCDALEDAPPATMRDGRVIRERYRPEILEYRSISRDVKGALDGLEKKERETTRISNLKIVYSKVYGYAFEITKAQLAKVPPHYVRKQTMASSERFVTEELKHLEEKIANAEEKLRRLEEMLFLELRARVAEAAPRLLMNAKIVASLDVLLSFAETALRWGYRRPSVHNGYDLNIVDGRHPIIETLYPHGEFVPNTTHLTEIQCHTLLITGPNMAGKSTIMRQVALISLMACAGSFVPAKEASIPCLDAIFTRIGSGDDLSQGQSTFMVEMSEVSNILKGATSRSLILIDEIGRGTSTYDGLALAWAILEYLHLELGAKTLFATHFHELTSLESSLKKLVNATVLVEKRQDRIVFLRKLVLGVCNKSYGVEVAGLASLPSKLLLRAQDILGHLESQSQRGERVRSRALEIPANQLVFFEEPRPSESLF